MRQRERTCPQPEGVKAPRSGNTVVPSYLTLVRESRRAGERPAP